MYTPIIFIGNACKSRQQCTLALPAGITDTTAQRNAMQCNTSQQLETHSS
jgi:hypothetical protein